MPSSRGELQIDNFSRDSALVPGDAGGGAAGSVCQITGRGASGGSGAKQHQSGKKSSQQSFRQVLFHSLYPPCGRGESLLPDVPERLLFSRKRNQKGLPVWGGRRTGYLYPAGGDWWQAETAHSFVTPAQGRTAAERGSILRMGDAGAPPIRYTRSKAGHCFNRLCASGRKHPFDCG